MFVVYTEVNISVIVKNMSAWGRDLLSFSVPGGTEKIAGLWFARGISIQAETICREKCWFVAVVSVIWKVEFMIIDLIHLQFQHFSINFYNES